jgi:hypothetical protein
MYYIKQMVWTCEIKFHEVSNDTIITIFKNNNLYVSCGFAHSSKSQDEKAFHMAEWIFWYAKKMMTDAKNNFTQLLEINKIVMDVLEYINTNHPRI